jgi:hypothetical protein
MIGPILLAAAMDAVSAQFAIVVAAAILFGSALIAYLFVPARVDRAEAQPQAAA